MRRKILYLMAFAGLIAVAAVLMVTNHKSSIRPRNINFALAQPSLVDRIVISNKTGRLILEKEGDRWRMNEKYAARTGTVTLFLQAMGRIEVLSPASKSILDSLTRRIDERGTQVMLFHGNKTLVSMRVYYEKEWIPGTYMMDERFRKPFRVGLTGYEGDNFAGLFNPGISQWKDNLLLDYRPGEIASVRLEYPLSPDQSFLITVSSGQAPRLDPLTAQETPGLADQQEVADYLTGFSDVHYVQPDSSGKESAGLKEPFAILTITGKSRLFYQMKAFRIFGSGSTAYDINRYDAILAGDSLPLIVRYSETDPIMRTYGDFLKK